MFDNVQWFLAIIATFPTKGNHPNLRFGNCKDTVAIAHVCL